ncbi:hypothetical protein CERSUDRAFT_157287 [Gelatoporia subvermispora B]|uniref:Major facilitator superfamily (MFS) profile domain-containing protein n=1 Tax=Ceriporiopsis subvermispora (strain B) TaxID=914234 RepID=M2QTT6_CERS8|nr:hypothetical protein CERSUDRAFT_157287 [Gelatoporia subvermispora B]
MSTSSPQSVPPAGAAGSVQVVEASGSNSALTATGNDTNALSKVDVVEKLQSEGGEDEGPKQDARFWLVYVAICTALLLAALDITSVSTAAPTIVSQLHGEDFTWVSTAYTLASAACLPMSGKLAQIFGRRSTMLGALLIFAVGSAVSGAAKSMTMLIVGRAIQGVGGGGIQSLTNIITADLVPLSKRGKFIAITTMMFAIGSLTGPFIAGGLAQDATWRWLFYMNLPICGVSTVLVFLFLRLHTPSGNLWLKLRNLDWIGNILIIGSTCAILLGLTWGGVTFAWDSRQVLACLIVGFVILIFAGIYEARWAKQPTIPMIILSRRMSLVGYLGLFIQNFLMIASGFYLPTWFQSVRLAGPLKSGVDLLPLCLSISPGAIIQGVVVAKTGRYHLLLIIGWILCVVGTALLAIQKRNTPFAVLEVGQYIQGIGIGLANALYFPTLAEVPVEQNASALAFFTFLRAFSQAWGVAIGGTILQNQLQAKLPAALLESVPQGAQLAYSIIPQIKTLPPALQEEVRTAFAESLSFMFKIMAGFSGLGLVSIAFIRDVPLKSETDKKWALKEREREREREEGNGADEKGVAEGEGIEDKSPVGVTES